MSFSFGITNPLFNTETETIIIRYNSKRFVYSFICGGLSFSFGITNPFFDTEAVINAVQESKRFGI